MNSQQIRRGVPHAFRIASSDTNTVTLLNPGLVVETAPTLVRHGVTDLYEGVITPDTLGQWSVMTFDASGNVTGEAHFECVEETDRALSRGLANRHHDCVVEGYSNLVFSGSSTGQTTTGNQVRTLVSKQGKQIAPRDGLVYGVEINADSDLATLGTSCRFFTASWRDDGGTDKFTVRGITEDLKGKATFPGGAAWTRVWFDKPIPVVAGDGFGLEENNTGNGSNVSATARRHLNAASIPLAIVSEYLTGALVAGTEYTPTTQSRYAAIESASVPVRLVMHPPDVALAGMSIPAGHPDTDTIYEDSGVAFDPSIDPAVLLSRETGLSCVNVSDGGTSITSWTGGQIDTILSQVRPAVLLFDTASTDAQTFTEATYVAQLDRLLAHCALYGTQLVLIESIVRNDNVVGGLSDEVEALNAVTRAWCAHVGVPMIPMLWALCRHSGGSEHLSLRRGLNDGSEDAAYGDYGDPDGTHLDSLDGIPPYVAALGRWFNGNRGSIGLLDPQATADAVRPINAAGVRLDTPISAVLGDDITVNGTVSDAAATTTSFTVQGLALDTAHYAGQYLIFTDDNLQGVSREIKSTSAGTTIELKKALPEAPADGTAFIIGGSA